MLRTTLALACAAALATAATAAAHPAKDRSCGLFTERDGALIGAVVERGARRARRRGGCCAGT